MIQNPKQNSKLRATLITIILATLPFYLLGIVVLLIGNSIKDRQSITPTLEATPSQGWFAETTATFTPTPTREPTKPPEPTQTPTNTEVPTATATFFIPSDTPTTAPTDTLTVPPTEPPTPAPTDTVAAPVEVLETTAAP